MGRSAKHATEAERVAAQKAQKAQYCATPRAKTLRSEQNRRAYERNHPFKYTMRLPDIPKLVGALAVTPLPLKSKLLQHYLKMTPTSDNDFALWNNPPPYTVSPLLLEIGLDNTIEALHGYRMRLQFKTEKMRIDSYRQEDQREVWLEVHHSLFRLVCEFKKLKKDLRNFKSSPLDYSMGQNLLQWKARYILALVEDWKALRDGKLELIAVHERRWYDMGLEG